MTGKPVRDAGTICPLHRKDVSKVCHTCDWYMQLRGADPQTGQPVDEWGCAMVWSVITTMENTQQTRQAGAAIESFRNRMVEQNERMLVHAAGGRPPALAETRGSNGNGADVG